MEEKTQSINLWGSEKLNLLILLFLFLTSSLAQADYKKLELYVSSEGNDANRGTPLSPIKSLYEAQDRADEFITNLDPNGESRNDIIRVKIYVSGIFYGQSFKWLHPHKNVHLEFKGLSEGATFFGFRHPCFSCEDGVVFFTAWSKVSDFKSYKGYTGYGNISIQNITVKYYAAAIKIAAWKDTKPTKVTIENNTFYRIGQIANRQWNPRWAAIMFQTIDNAIIKNNRFIHNANVDEARFMHGIYIKDSDKNQFKHNYFQNISGAPIKLRNGSDKNMIVGNTFRKGITSVNLFPIQNWYSGWQFPDSHWSDPNERELPSFGNVIDNNRYENGYINTPFTLHPVHSKILCTNRTIASPRVLPETYLAAAEKVGTSSRFIVRGRKFYRTHWYQMCY